MSDKAVKEKPVWEFSRFSSTQAVREVPCPLCKEAAGKDCLLSINGESKRRLQGVHKERVVSYRLSIGADEFKRRHVTSPATVSYIDIWGPQAPNLSAKRPNNYSIRKGERI